MFLVVLSRTGPAYDHAFPVEGQSLWDEHAAFMDGLVEQRFIVLGGPLEDEIRTAHAVEAESPEDIRAVFALDPWSETHLRVESIDEWEIRLDGRRANSG